MQKGVKFRIYPNKEQQTIINQTFGCCRLIYNKGLVMRNEAHRNGNKIGYLQTSVMLTELKKQESLCFNCGECQNCRMIKIATIEMSVTIWNC